MSATTGKYAGYTWKLENIHRDQLTESEAQPEYRNDMSLGKRKKLTEDMLLKGQKDFLDVALLDGKYLIIEGHGRWLASFSLANPYLSCKVYPVTDREDCFRLRNAIRDSEATKLPLSSANLTEWIYREYRAGNREAINEVGKKAELVKFLLEQAPENAEELICVDNVSTYALQTARLIVRRSEGLSVNGPLDKTYAPFVMQCLKWVLKYDATHPAANYIRNGGAAKKVKEAVLDDKPCPELRDLVRARA